MKYENLFSAVSSIRVALGVLFALFILCFVVIIVEETFLGGRRRRKAEKQARERGAANYSAVAHAPQNPDAPAKK